MWAGDLSKLEISKTFYTHYTRVASFDLGEKQTQETIFFEVRSSPRSHHPVIENCLFQHDVKQPIKLTSWTIFFLPQHYTKGIQSSADGTSQLATFSFTFAHIASVFSCFGAHSRSQLVASLTGGQIYKHILALKEFSQTIFLSRKQAFKFELLFYCLITVSTLCQPPSVNFGMSNLCPTITHT